MMERTYYLKYGSRRGPRGPWPCPFIGIHDAGGNLLYSMMPRRPLTLRKEYRLLDPASQTILETRQDRLFPFPSHSLLEAGRPVGRAGIRRPGIFFIELEGLPVMEINLRGPFWRGWTLSGGGGPVARVRAEPFRLRWRVEIAPGNDSPALLAALCLAWEASNSD